MGDIPGVGMVMIGGIVRSGRRCNMPPATELPVVIGAWGDAEQVLRGSGDESFSVAVELISIPCA